LLPILEAEEREDWDEVERLSRALEMELLDPGFRVAEIANHYLDDMEIRQRDPGYGVSQREELRRYIETGEDRTIYLPTWTCPAILFLLIAIVVYWLAF
jgi:hypothetical protein